MSSDDAPRLVLVAGAGRSGTSTMSGILSRLGLHVPLPEVAPDRSNPRGFGEPRWVVDFHDRLLARTGVQVADARPVAWHLAERYDDRDARELRRWLEAQLEISPRLLVKDPRLPWFLPLWSAVGLRCGVEPDYVTMLRPPPEVVASRRTHYNRGLDDAHGVAGWVNLMLGTERATRDARRRVFVEYHALLDDWAAATRRVGSALGLDTTRLDDEAGRAVADFVDPGLRRARASWDDLVLPPRLATIAGSVWASLTQAAEGWHDPVVLDAARSAYDCMYGEAEAITRSSLLAARSDGPPPRAGRRWSVLAR